VSVVLSLGRYVEHAEAMGVLAPQSGFVQKRQQLRVSRQLETSCVAMHGRVLERDDGKVRRMVETSDAETIARSFLLGPGIVLANRVIENNLGEQWVVRREVVCGVAVLVLALVHGDGADRTDAPCDQSVGGNGNGIGSTDTH
jgi:hypothetical protein